MNKLLIFLLISILSASIALCPYQQEAQAAVNWLQVCRHPLVDPFITEPCESLTSPDGYQLTDEGKRVLICLLGGSIAKLYQIPDTEIQALAPIAGCGGAGSLPNQNPQVTDLFEVYANGLNGNSVTISTDVNGNHLEKTVSGYQNYHATFHFYAGRAPIGSFVNICVKNNNNFQQYCQSLTHTVNPELVTITSP